MKFSAGIFLIISGFLIFILMIFTGLAHPGIFIVFPFIISSSPLSIIPVILIFAGFILLATAPFNVKNNNENGNIIPEEKIEKKTGGFLMIGPIPIIFGNDKRLVYISMVIAMIIIVLYIVFIFHLL